MAILDVSRSGRSSNWAVEPSPAMDTILVKIFATALALSEVTTQPQAVKTHFDPAQDQARWCRFCATAAPICARRSISNPSISTSLIATALDDPKALGADIKAFHGINFADLNTAYRQFCKNETVANAGGRPRPGHRRSSITPRPICPTRRALKGRKLPSLSVVLDGKGGRFRRRVRAGQPARLGPARRRSGFRAKGLRRRRGPAFLPASRRRRARHHPRLHRQSRRAGPAAGRLDHHPAGGEEPPGRRGRDL